MANQSSDIFVSNPQSESAGLVPRIDCVARRAWRRLSASLLAVGLAVLAPLAQANFTNGGFETGDWTGWTVDYYKNNSGISTFPPTTKANLSLTASDATTNINNTSVLGTPPVTDGPLTIPLQGGWSASINHRGNNWRASGINQNATVGLGDVDPTDGKVHVRFAVAPVIQDGGHAPAAQAYFFVQVKNLTKSTTMFTTFNFANQPGVPWQNVGGYQYTGWQAVDVSPGNGFLDVGDLINVEIIASGCDASGHSGEVYVDSVGPFFMGLAVSAVGPTTSKPGNDVTYTYHYSNNSGLTISNVTVDAVTPQTLTSGAVLISSTFVSVNAPGATCSTPAAGSSGTVSCNFGTLNDKASGAYTVTYNIPGTATTTAPNNMLNHGNYRIGGDGASTFLGPLVQTELLLGTTVFTDLAVTVSDGVSAVAPNGALTYTVTVTNSGPTAVTGATLSQTVSQLTVGSWTCTATGSGTCPASGSGTLTGVLMDLPVGAIATFTVPATAAATGPTSTVFTAAVPSGITDSNTANNAAGDTNTVGTLALLTLNKSGTGVGTVISVPTGINCGTACVTPQTMDVADTTNVILTASAPSGSTFTGWTGDCTGSTNPCTVTMNGAKTVTANFDIAYVVSATAGAHGAINPATAIVVAPGGTASYVVTPNSGYAAATPTGGTCAAGSWSGSTYTTGAVNADCTVIFSFALLTPDMAISLTGLPATAVVGVAYAGTIACTNGGDLAASAGTTCTVSSLPAGVTGGACTITGGASWTAGTAVPVGSVVTCAVSGTPTTAGTTTASGSTGATGDSNAGNNTATLSIDTVNPPTPVADTTSSIAGTAGTFDVSTNDAPLVGSTYSQTGTTCSPQGSISSAGVAAFTAPGTIDATCTVSYQVCNPSPYQATCASSTLTVTASAPTLTAVPDATNTPTGTSATFDVAANDTKPVGATYSLTGGTCSAASVSSVGSAGFSAPTTAGNTCTVIYSVCDPAPNDSTCASATLTVTAAAVPPTVVADATNTVAGTAGTFNVSTNDTTPAGSTYSQTGTTCSPAGSMSSAGVASFTAPGTIDATCTVSYQVCNPAPDGATCASSTLTVTASAPVALASIPTLSEYVMLLLSGLLLLFGLVSLRRRVKA